MGFFDKLKNMTNNIQRDPDVIEGACASIALVAAVGGITPEEEKAAKKTATTSKALLSTGFTAAEIERMLDKFFDRIEQGGRAVRSEMYKELEEVRAKDGDGSKGQTILLIALDVADQGGLDPEEEKVLRTIAEKLGVNYDSVAAI